MSHLLSSSALSVHVFGPRRREAGSRLVQGMLAGLIALLLLLAGLGTAPVHAQEGIRCTTTVAQALITTGQDVFFSAEPRSTENGSAIFFWSTGDLERNGSNSDGNIELFRSRLVFNADGSVSRTFKQITRSTGSILGGFNLAPDISPDGHFLAFFSDRHYPDSGFDNRDGNFEIFVADLRDENAVRIRQITNTTQGSNLYPSISNDGTRIAFISDNGLDPATAGNVADEARNLDIYLADLSSGTPLFRQINQTALGTLNEAPSLSGNGTKIVFASTQRAQTPTSPILNPEGNQEIFVYDIVGDGLTALTSTAGGVNEMPVISGDGATIAFVSDQRLDPNVNIVGERQLFLHSATGSGFLQVSDAVGADNFDPNISADGQRIIYQRQDGFGQRVVLYDSVSRSHQVFRSRTNPTTGEVGQPIVSGNGTVIFYEDEGGISAIECSISDLGLTAAVTPSTVLAGQSQSYVWTVANLDQAVASGVQVQATLPTGFRLTALEPATGCTVDGQVISCGFQRLEVAAAETMTATVAVDPATVGNQVVKINAFSSTSSDRNPYNNDQNLGVSVLAQADLGVVKSAFPDTALQGELITYTLVVSNTGPALARSVQLTDNLPVGLIFVSSPSCSAAGPLVSCSLGDMQPGATFSTTIRTRIVAQQELDIANVALVLSDETTDPAPLNNSVAVTNSINTKFDLAVAQTVEPAQLVAGAPLTYTIVVTNFGPSSAATVQLSTTLPVELVAIGDAVVDGAGGCTSGAAFTCNLGTLDRDQSVTVRVSALISPTFGGTLITSARVRSLTEANADRNDANDQSVLTATTQQRANLVAAKRASLATVVAGSNMTYTLGVVNAGPSAASAVTISDTVPAGLVLTGLATSLGTCTGSSLVFCQIAGLLPGEGATVTVTVRVAPTTFGVITNTVAVGAITGEVDPDDNSASVATTVTDQVSLALAMRASVNAVTAGQSSYFYTLDVGNGGPSLARSVLLTNTLPAGVSFVGSSSPSGATCNSAASVVLCDLGSVGAGVTQTVRLDVQAEPGAVGLLISSAQVSTSSFDPGGVQTTTATVVATQNADLQVTKAAAINNLNVGGVVTYTVVVDNFGPSNASGVVISDLLPTALTGPAVSVVQGSYSLATSLWSVGSIAAGQKLTMTVAGAIGSAASGRVITNTALVYAVNQTDPVVFNNGQFVTFTVPLNANVAVLQSASSLSPSVQSLVTLVITATNHGPETATNVRVTDGLPSQMAFVSQIASRGSYSPTTGVWSVGSLAANASAALTLTAQVQGSGSFINQAVVSATEYDDKPADNRSTLGFVVGAAADLRLEQSASSLNPNVGDTLFLTFTLTNDGPDAVTDVQVLNALSAGMTDVFVTPAAGTTYSLTVGLWDLPLVAAGQSLTLVMSKTVSVSGVQTSTGEIVASSLFDPDSTPGNGVGNGEDDQSSLTVTMPPAADMGVSMSASGGQLVGQDVLLQIQVINNGPDPATSIILTETLDPDLTYSTHLVVGSGSYNPGTGLWTIPSLGVGSFTILNVTARVGPGAAGRYVTEAIEGISLNQFDPISSNNAASVSFQVGGADLAVSKSVNRTTADVGGQVVYTVQVVNNGPSPTAFVRITDSLPISLTGIISQTSAGVFGPNTPGGQGIWTIPELGVGMSETLVLTGTVIPGSANRVITNTISGASSGVADGDNTNQTPAVGFRVTAADLVLQKSSTITQPQEGESFFYILNVTNVGPDRATNVVVTDTMSFGMTATVAGAGYNIYTGRWEVGDINPNQSRSLLLTVNPIPDVAGGLVIVDPIDAKQADQEDPTPAINATARVTISVVGADLRLVKSVSKSAPNVGETVRFTTTFVNPGPYATGQVVITDTLPAGLTLLGAPAVTVGSLDVDASTRLYTWTHSSTAINQTARLNITGTVEIGTGGQSLISRARIVSAARSGGGAMPDPNKANNAVATTVTPQEADLTIALLDSPSPVEAGAALLYSAVITNSGPTSAADQSVTLNLAAGLILNSASPLCDTSAFPTVVCTASTALGVNTSRTFTVEVVSNSVTTLNAGASVATSTPETNPANNSAAAVTTVTPATANRLVITGSGSQTAGNSQNLTITAYDVFGNVSASYTGDKSLTFSGAGAAGDGTGPTVTDSTGAAIAIGSPTTITFSSGVATVSGNSNGRMTLYASGVVTVAVSDGSIAAAGADRLAVTVNPGAAVQLVIGGSLTQTAGITQSLTITAHDSFSNTAVSYTGNKSLTFSGANAAIDGTQPTVVNSSGAAIAFGSATVVNFSSGVATVNSNKNGVLALYKAETATISVSDGSISAAGGGELTVTVSPADPQKLVISGASTQTAGTSQSLTVTAQDSFSNTAVSYTGGVSVTVSGAGIAPDGTAPTIAASSGVTVALGNPLTLTFSSGVATVSGSSNGLLALYAAETATISITDGLLDSSGGGDLTVVVSAGAATRLVFATQPSSAASAGTDFAQQPVVEIRDAYDNVPAVSDDISLAAFTDSSCSVAAGGVLSNTGPVAATSGVATFSGVSYSASETIRLRAEDDSDGSVATACSDPVVIDAGAAGSLTVETQPAGAVAGAIFSTQPVVALRDSLNNIVVTDSTSTVTVTVQSGSGSFVSSTTSGVAVNGVVTFTNLRLDVADSYTLQFATSAGSFTVNSNSFSVASGSPTRLVISGATSQSAGTSQDLTITAQDSVGNTATSFTGDKSVTFGGALPAPDLTPPTVTDKVGTPVAFGLPLSLTFSSGVATATGNNGSLTLVRAITTSVAVTDSSGLTSQSSGNLTVTVSAGAATRLLLGGSASQTAGVTQSLTITALDTFDNPATGYTGSKSLLFAGASAAINGAQPAVRSSGGTTVTFGTATAISFASGVATVSNGNNGVLYLVRAQAATLAVTDTNNTAVTSFPDGNLAVTVSPAAPTALVISGASTQTAGVGQNLTITAQDAFSNTATSYTGSKSLTFGGASVAPDATQPTVSNNVGVLRNFGQTTPLTFAGGIAVSSGSVNGQMTLYAAETATITVTDGAIGSSGPGNLAVTVSPGPAKALVFSTAPPASATAGVAFSPAPVVQVRDDFDNVAAVSDTVALTAFANSGCTSAAPGVLSGASVAAVNGVATFASLTYSQAGTIYLKATDASDGAVTTACAGAVAVSAGAAGSLTVESQPLTATAGVTMTALVVALRDNLSNIVTTNNTATVTVTVTSGPGSFTAGATTSGVLSSGVITFSNLRLDKAGNYVLRFATSAGSFTVDSATIAVGSGAAVKLVLSGVSSQSAGATQPITITARDAFSNTATGYTGSQSLTFGGAGAAPDGTLPTVTDSGGATVEFGSTTAIDFSAGVATVSGGANGLLRLVKVGISVVAVTDTVNSLVAAGSDVLTVTVTPGSGARLAIGGSATQTAGLTQTLTITALDSLGNVASGYTGVKSLTFSGASSAPGGTSPTVRNNTGGLVLFGSPTNINFSSGVATVSGGNNGVMALYKQETAVIAATDGAISATGSDRLTVVVSTAAASQLAFSTQPPATAQAGVNLSPAPVVQVQDQYANVVSVSHAISLTASLSSSCAAGNDGSGSLSGSTVNASSGVATFSSLFYSKVETIYLKATNVTSGTVTSTCSTAVAVAHGPASQVVITQQPGNASANSVFIQQPILELRDSQGNVVTSDSSSKVTATKFSGPGVIHGSSNYQITFVNGVATYADLRIDTSGSYVLQFTTTPGGLTVQSASFNVSSGSAIRLAITGSGSQTAGSSQNLTISALDNANNVDTTYTGNKFLTFSGASVATSGANPTVTDKDGIARNFGVATAITFNNGVATVSGGSNGAMVLVKSENIEVSVTDGGLSSSGAYNLAVNVSPGAANNLVFSQQPSSTATAGVDLAQQPSVQIRDQFHNPTVDTNTIVLTPFTNAGCTTAATGTLNGGSGTGAILGVASFSGVNYTKAESVRLKATSGALTAACSDAIVVSAASPAKLVIGGSATQTAGISQNLVITAQDSFSNTATSYTGDKSLTFSGATAAPSGTNPTVANKTGTQVNFGAATTINFVNGVATAIGGTNGALRLVKTESATINVTDGSIDSTAGGSLAVTVSGGAPNNLIFNQQPSTNATAGQAFGTQPIVHIRDQFNNTSPVTDTVTLTAFAGSGCSTAPNGTLSGGSVAAVAGVATFTGVSYTKAETISLRAADSSTGGVTTACSNATTLAAGAAGKYVVEVTGTPTASQNVFVTAQLADANGNPVATSGKTVTWSSSGGGSFSAPTSATNGSGLASVQFTTNSAAGTAHTVTATDGDTFTGSSAVFTTTAGSFVKLQLLVPGETAAPGTGSGKSGSPSAQSARIPFTVTVNAVDANWNLVSSATDTVAISSSDGAATLPANAALASGSRVFTATLNSAGGQTLTATDITDGGKSASTSPSISVIRAFTITKSASPSPVIAGQTITYTVTIVKNALAAGTNVLLTDTLPVTVTGVISSTSGGLTCSGTTTVTCNVASLAANASAVLTLTGTVSAGAAHNSSLVNSASVSANGMTSAESAQATTTVQRVAALSITKTASSATVTAGNDITYTVRITNTGPSNASTILLTDTLPVTVTGVTSTTSGGLVCSGTTPVTCSLSSLAVNGSAVLTLTGTVNPAAVHNSSLVNSASVTAAEATSAQTAQTTTTVQRSVALGIGKTATPNPAIAGSLIAYTVYITNTGPSLASNVQLTDTLPAGLTGITSSATGGLSCSGTTNITCSVSTLAVNGSATLTITGTVSAGTANGATLVNTAGVTAAEVGTSQLAQTSTTVNRSVALAITKSASTASVVAGNPIVYTVRITNTGPSNASTILLTDTLPVAVTGVTSTTSGGLVCSGTTTVTCSLGSLAVNGSAVLTLTGTVNPAAANNSSLVNSASVTAAEATTAQNAQTTTTVTTQADLSISKSQVVTGTVVGATITYTLRITNTGPSNAATVYVTDTLPVSVSFGSVVGMSPVNFFGAASVSGKTITWLTSTLSANASGFITFTGTITGSGTLINSVQISSATSDGTPGNNSASTAGLSVAGNAMALSLADLWLEVESSPARVTLGEPGEAIFRAGNRGPLPVEGARVTIVSAAPLVVYLLTDQAMACPWSDGRVVCALPALPAGSGVRLSVSIPAEMAGQVNTDWLIESDFFDPNPDDNRLSQGWQVGALEWRYFLPGVQASVDGERSKPDADEIFLPAVSGE